MIESLPDVPPALLLLVNETAHCQSRGEMRKRIRQLLPELRDQSEAYELTNWGREGYRGTSISFDVHIHGGLDLLSGVGCIQPECRLATADRLARSVGLIADRVWLTDFLSHRFVNFGRATNNKLDVVIDDTIVLRRVLPLILAGVVRFRSPWGPTCSECLSAAGQQIETVSKDLAKMFRKDFRMERMANGEWAVHTGQCLAPEIVVWGQVGESGKIPTVINFSRNWISRQLRSLFWVARAASVGRGVLFSNSRVGLAGLALQEGRLYDKSSLMIMESERNIDVPWVSDLDALQIVQLRQEASKALPAFREQMAEALCVGDSPSSGSFIHKLRSQTTAVQAELLATRSKSQKYWKTVYGLLGLGLSAYGVATNQVTPGVGGILSVLQLLINHKIGYEADMLKLESQPGYVLVKAQDLLAHAHPE